MRKTLPPLLLALLASLSAYSQFCLPDGITFTTQAQVDNFKINYPGCTTIGGDVKVFQSTVSNLNGLNEITTIGGNLWLQNNIWLSTLNGLQNLDSIGGIIYIVNNEQLYSLTGLSQLKTVPGGIGISTNPSLTSLNGLHNLTSIGSLFLEWQGFLTDLSPLNKLTSINGDLTLNYVAKIKDLAGLSNIQSVGGNIQLRNCQDLTSFNGLQQLDSINGNLWLADNPKISDLSGLDGIQFVSGDLTIERCNQMNSLNGLNQLNAIGGGLLLHDNPVLANLATLAPIQQISGSIEIHKSNLLTDLQGLEGLSSIGRLSLDQNPALSSLAGLENVATLSQSLEITRNPVLTNLSALSKLKAAPGGIIVDQNAQLASLNGLHNIDSVGITLRIGYNPALSSLSGLEQLTTVSGSVQINANNILTDISALGGLLQVSEGFNVWSNPQLSNCAISSLCHQINLAPNMVYIEANAPGCNNPAEVAAFCVVKPVVATVLLDSDGDCIPDTGEPPIPGLRIQFSADTQLELKPGDGNGQAEFGYIDQALLTLSLPQFPNEQWAVCQNDIQINPDTVGGDTIRATFLLQALQNCPALSVQMGLPPDFRDDCATASEVVVLTQNIGTIDAQGVQTALVLPPAFEILQANPAPSAQNGDTLFFAGGDLAPFATAELRLSVRAKCNNFESTQTLCWEAFSTSTNTCTAPPPTFSEIKLSAGCTGDSLHFTLKNIGGATTQNPHTYTIIRNKYIQQTETFSLAPQESRTLAVPADGATWRLEATKFDDGTRTSTSLEGCGGFAAGFINAFWQDHGPLGSDFGCRQLLPAVAEPVRKSASPSGVGPTFLLAPGQPLQYTIEFENTGADTVTSVLINDVLPPELAAGSFYPVAASHPYTWKIRPGNQLEVQFPAIQLPGNSTNPEGSKGYFTFSIGQNPGLANGALLNNTATVELNGQKVFTNPYWHTIGEPFPKGLACAPGGIQFYDQLGVDRFPVDYPGCQRIEGPVVLQNTMVENLHALNEVTYMGSLTLFDNNYLQDLSGLNSLDSCGDMAIINNSVLANLNGLWQVQTLSSLWIESNPSMTSLAGLNNLESVSGDFWHRGTAVSDLSPLSKLRWVGGELSPASGTNIQNLQGLEKLDSVGSHLDLSYSTLTSLAGLNSLIAIGGDFLLRDDPQLAFIPALPKLKTIGGSLRVENTGLQAFGGLDSLIVIGGELQVLNNPVLGEMTSLKNLKTIDSNLSIYQNPNLYLLGGLSRLDSVSGDLEISFNPKLNEITGLSRLKSVGGDFNFVGNDIFVTFGGLDSLLRIGGGLSISENQNLNYLNGLHRLQTIGGALLLRNNPKLIDLFGFESLDSVGGNLSIGLTGLTNLYDLLNLRRVGENFALFKNPHLVDVDSLIQLQSIGGDLYLEANDALKNLSGLAKLDSIGGSLSILSNTDLLSLDGLQLLQKIPLDVFIENNPALIDLNGLQGISSVAGEVKLFNNTALTGLNGLSGLKTIGGNFTVRYTAPLKDFSGLEQLESIGGYLLVSNHDNLESFAGLTALETIGGGLIVENNFELKNFAGLTGLRTVGGLLSIGPYNGLTSLAGLDSLTSVASDVFISDNYFLSSLNSLNLLTSVPGNLRILNNPALKKVDGFGGLNSVGLILHLEDNAALTGLDSLKNLTLIGESAVFINNDSLANLSGLDQLKTIEHSLSVAENALLTSLHGLEALQSIGGALEIRSNPVLTSLGALKSLQSINGEYLVVIDNPMLSDCSVLGVCEYLYSLPGWVDISNNAPGCNNIPEVEATCLSTPVQVTVLLDNNGDCLPDAGDTPVEAVQIQLAGSSQMTIRPSSADGLAFFNYLESGPFALQLPQFPTGYWAACQDKITLTPGLLPDTLFATFVLKPLGQCPELTVQLNLPSMFRGCLVSSEVQLSTKNTGADLAEGVQTAVVVPDVLDILSLSHQPIAQSGDTLWFDLGDLFPFEMAKIKMTVQTKCDTFLIGHALCWEAFSDLANPCAVTPIAFSEIKLSAACTGDSVWFTLKNIGDAPTITPHAYRIIRNDKELSTGSFSLNNHQSMLVGLPADGATYRMEATKFNNGALTATAIENCGGFTPGFITAYWLDKGPPEYDVDCRQVIGSFDPNQKTAIPTGAGPDYLLGANQALDYTIDFQNTGTDTAFRVLLRDVLSPNLELISFEPGFASHPYSWEIRSNTLEVLFSPIALPDSNVNEPGSQGFFSFRIHQLPDLPPGTTIENTAAIIFDFNPPIGTNTVRHTIGQLSVRVDAPQPYARLWQLAGNPTRDAATFSALEYIGGEKRFELYNAGGQLVQLARFGGQSFEFRREGLPGGWYVFRILDARGRVFTGKVVVVE